MLSFLIGLFLMFSTVQNNCEGAATTLEELKETVNKLRQGAGPPPSQLTCTSVSECPQTPQANGCISSGAGTQGYCEECNYVLQLPANSGATVDGCSSGSGDNGTITTCTSASPCPKNQGCVLPSGGNQGSCFDCSIAPTLAANGGTVTGCGSSGNGTGNPGNVSLNCESASDCKGQAGGPYGCGKFPGGSKKMCISCEVVNSDPTGSTLSADGCSQGEGLRLNTM